MKLKILMIPGCRKTQAIANSKSVGKRGILSRIILLYNILTRTLFRNGKVHGAMAQSEFIILVYTCDSNLVFREWTPEMKKLVDYKDENDGTYGTILYSIASVQLTTRR